MLKSSRVNHTALLNLLYSNIALKREEEEKKSKSKQNFNKTLAVFTLKSDAIKYLCDESFFENNCRNKNKKLNKAKQQNFKVTRTTIFEFTSKFQYSR